MAVVIDFWIWRRTRTRMLFKYFKKSLFLIDFYNERFTVAIGCFVF